MSTAKHTPGRQCDECEGMCLRPATIDDAMTALTVACTRRDELIACDALVAAASTRAQQLRAVIAKDVGGDAMTAHHADTTLLDVSALLRRADRAVNEACLRERTKYFWNGYRKGLEDLRDGTGRRLAEKDLLTQQATCLLQRGTGCGVSRSAS